MGPMGRVVLSEQIQSLGGSPDRFPREKLGELIESVSREIFDESIRETFCRNMSVGARALHKS
jgi:hypothetical protein